MLSLLVSLAGAIAILLWRVRETRTPVSARSILIPPLGMATGFGMFMSPIFRVPWTWAATAFLTGGLALAYPLIKTSRLVRSGDMVTMQRSNVFFAVLILLAGIRIAARTYFDTLLTVPQTAGLFFVLAFGMIVRWRMDMYLQYQALLTRTPPFGDGGEHRTT